MNDIQQFEKVMTIIQRQHDEIRHLKKSDSETRQLVKELLEINNTSVKIINELLLFKNSIHHILDYAALNPQIIEPEFYPDEPKLKKVTIH